MAAFDDGGDLVFFRLNLTPNDLQGDRRLQVRRCVALLILIY